MGQTAAALPCKVCNEPVVAHGFCDKHYRRWRSTGDPSRTKRPEDWGRRESHPLYGRWAYMKRVTAGRHRLWDDFWVFVKDVGVAPSANHVLSRRDRLEPWGPANFYWRETQRGLGLDSSEKRAAYMREWHRRNPHRSKHYDLKKSYGIGIEDYSDMLDRQEGKCAICRTAKARTPKGLCVDHCHKSKMVRGLLCDDCNRGIGIFKDDPALLRAAILYLEQPRGTFPSPA